MPRANRPRTVATEENLASRIAYERDRRGLSYEALAKLLTEAGCSIAGSAIYKIEKGEPRRRITVDELAALADVFGLSISDLLIPVQLVEQQRAAELLENLQKGNRGLYELTAEVSNNIAALAVLGQEEPDIYDFVMGHFLHDPWGDSGGTGSDVEVGEDDESDGASRAMAFLLTDVANRYWHAVVSVTLMYMNTLLAQESGEGPADEEVAAWVAEWESREFSVPEPGEARAKLVARVEEWVERMRSANGIDQEA